MSAGQSTVDVPPDVLEFLAQQHTLTLATASPTGVPRATTLLYVSDGPTLYFWSRANSGTAQQLQSNPIVAFTVDAYTEDLNQTRGIQGVGECTVLLSGERIAFVADLFGRKFPSLAPGSTMSISFFKITPSELQFIDNTRSTSAGPEGMFGAEFHRKRSYSVIQALPLRPANTIVQSLPPLEVKAGETIVRAGTPADKFFVLVEGEAEMSHAGETTRLSPGELFGEVAIMRDQPRGATVTAKTDVKLLGLDRDGFRELIAQSMEITPDFDQVIRDRLNVDEQ
jgi:uncharacterized protein YhbP (UPF0306 family)